MNRSQYRFICIPARLVNKSEENQSLYYNSSPPSPSTASDTKPICWWSRRMAALSFLQFEWTKRTLFRFIRHNSSILSTATPSMEIIYAVDVKMTNDGEDFERVLAMDISCTNLLACSCYYLLPSSKLKYSPHIVSTYGDFSFHFCPLRCLPFTFKSLTASGQIILLRLRLCAGATVAFRLSRHIERPYRADHLESRRNPFARMQSNRCLPHIQNESQLRTWLEFVERHSYLEWLYQYDGTRLSTRDERRHSNGEIRFSQRSRECLVFWR